MIYLFQCIVTDMRKDNIELSHRDTSSSIYEYNLKDLESLRVLERLRNASKCNSKCELLSIHNGSINIDDIIDIHDGNAKIFVQGVTFPCFFKHGSGQYLYVFLSSAHGTNKEIPIFHRHSYSTLVNDNILCVDDPLYGIVDGLTNGWFIGTDKVDYSYLVSQLIIKISQILNILECNIIVGGSSSGGTAAIHVSSWIPNVCTLAINPQIMPEINKWTVSFSKETGYQLIQFGERTDTEYLLHKKQGPTLIICNIADYTDALQILRLSNRNASGYKLGFQSISDNVFVWLYDVYGVPGKFIAHACQETRSMFKFIDYILKMIIKKKIVDSTLLTIINEMWHDHYSSITDVFLNEIKVKMRGNDIEKKSAYAILCSKSMNNPDALLLLAKCYQFGIGTEVNINLAIITYAKIHIERTEAYQNLMELLKKSKDKEQCQFAYDITLKHIDFDDPVSYGYLGWMYATEYHVEFNYKIAQEMLLKSLEYNYNWLDLYLRVMWNNSSEETFINEVERFVEIECKYAQVWLGRAYREGHGKCVDYSIARKCFNIAYNNGVKWAIYEDFQTIWIMNDDKLDIELFKEVSKLSKNDLNAKAWLGKMIYYGRGTTPDSKMGKSLMKQAAESGIIWAEKELNSYK